MSKIFNLNVNPILIRELRQFVRSHFIIFLINFYVLALVVVSIMVLLNMLNNQTLGRELIFALGIVVFWASVLSIVLRTAWSTSHDKINEDLMFYSSMKPSTIVWGKILSGMICTLILLSVTMPFVTLAYILRGIDIGTSIIVFVQIFLIVQILNGMAVLSAASTKMKSAPYQSLFTLIVAAFFGNFFTFATLAAVIYEGGRAWSGFWSICSIFLLIEVGAFSLLVLGAVALFSPLTSNRVFPIRIALTVYFIVGFLLVFFDVFGMYFGVSVTSGLLTFEIICLVFLAFMIPSIVCERDRWSFRIRRDLPKSALLRILLFPFYTGTACGLVWAVMLAAVIVVIDLMYLQYTSGSISYLLSNKRQCPVSLGWLVFSFDYCVTAMLIRGRFFPKLDTTKTWIIVLALITLFSPVTVLIYILISQGSLTQIMYNSLLNDYANSVFSALNPFCNIVSDGGYNSMAILGMTVWTSLLFLILLFWYKRQIGKFSPNATEENLITFEEAKQIIQNIETPNNS
ncbi:MAG: hypothetical protein LBQ66_08470 [Planctomycetaceae bacterium]|jgi:hypothetical protein|nr:hypothetical protein [Planctomycetaceae bacterium]